MKRQTNRNALKYFACITGRKLVYAGYCDLWYLLQGIDPPEYAAGVYGWNYDVYYFADVIVCTGYRGMPGKRANGIKEYEEKAKKIYKSKKYKWETKMRKLSELRDEFSGQA